MTDIADTTHIGRLGPCSSRSPTRSGRSSSTLASLAARSAPTSLRGGRWIEVAPSGSAIAIALVPPSDGRSAGSDEAHCALATEDIEADHATLRARGVEVDHGGLAGATGWCFAGSPGSARRRELAARYPESREAQTCGTCC
jgi:hypothetical protein